MQVPNETRQVEYTIVDKSGERLSNQDVKHRMAEHYGDGSMERHLHTVPVVNHYGYIGSVCYSLEGSPPKGYALYISDLQGHLTFYDVRGIPYEKWKYVSLEFDQP